jgi:hypothetical protein
VVRETNEPPAAIGVAAATHIYRCCGTYLARFTVIDDDGGVRTDSLHIRVVSLENPGFESGFRNRLVGTVGNGWEPYVEAGAAFATTRGAGSAAEVFKAEEFVVHGAQRSQRIGANGRFRAGIYQQIGANRGWDYQVSAWYHLDERGGGICRLGINPQGGTDPDAPGVVWTQGSEHRDWAQLLERVTAQTQRITIFLEVGSDESAAAGYFDDVLLLPYPCQLKECKPEPPPKERKACVDWKDEREPRTLGEEHHKAGFTLNSRTKLPMMIALWGDPPNQGKLQFPARGIRVSLPFEADRVVAQVASYTSQPVRMQAFAENGSLLGEASTAQGAQGTVTSLEIAVEGITALEFSGGGNEGLLVELCVFQVPGEQKANRPAVGLKAAATGAKPAARKE